MRYRQSGRQKLLPGPTFNITPEEPSSDFTDRVMSRLPDYIPADAEQAGQLSSQRTWRLRPEVAHALVASAATYVFLSAGLLEAVMRLNPYAMEAGLYGRLTAVLDWVDRVAEVIRY